MLTLIVMVCLAGIKRVGTSAKPVFSSVSSKLSGS